MAGDTDQRTPTGPKSLRLPFVRRKRLRQAQRHVEVLLQQIDELHQQLADCRSHGIVANLAIELEEPFRRFLALIGPKAVVGRRKVRIGGANDGGYVMIDDFDGVATVLSGGVGDNVTWDADIARRGMDVLQYDPTVPGPPEENARFRFHPLALAGEKREGATTLAEVVARIEGPAIGKIDIEGDEWGVLATARHEDLKRFRQLVVEFHGTTAFGDPAWRERAFRALENIAVTHQSVHVHGNNCAPLAVIGGIAFPDIFEVTYLSRDLYSFEDDNAVYPTEIDAPNGPWFSDYRIGSWPALTAPPARRPA